MKKLSLVVLMTAVLAGCTAHVYSGKGNATILSSKALDVNTVELTAQKDNGEVVTLVRQYDAHATVGSRIVVGDAAANRDEDLKTIRRYEFK
ncbi:deoxyribose-phosphate aldolase [Pasteurellaceae bacterium Orientalotternb1]|nr:deoxyribose-phosphate aldolase [Pasteurellaceae bacterium Orientalotternb1]